MTPIHKRPLNESKNSIFSFLTQILYDISINVLSIYLFIYLFIHLTLLNTIYL
jgi:hypothetical protein